jgi:hypothetical protein
MNGLMLALLVLPPSLVAAAKTVGKPIAAGCDSNVPVFEFVVDSSGDVTDKGKTLEGPACLKIWYNPLQFKAGIHILETTVAGPDLSSALGGQKAGAESRVATTETKAPVSLNDKFENLKKDVKAIATRVNALPQSYANAMDAQQATIDAVKAFVVGSENSDPHQLPAMIKSNYNNNIRSALANAKAKARTFISSDLSDGGSSILSDIRTAQSSLQSFPIDNSSEWKDWYAANKDAYDGLKQSLLSLQGDAEKFGSSSDNVSKLKDKVGLVRSWDGVLANIGLRTDMLPDEVTNADISAAFVLWKSIHCGTLFNQTSKDAVSVVTMDQTVTFDGKSPSVKANDPFVTVACSTPFSITGGIAFSLIEQKEFAIIKSSGPNNTSVNKFGTLNSSQVHPMPMAMVHARLADWGRHKYALHASTGVAGNIQGKDSGGSSAEFLLGPSLSFWRTMYLSLGLHIGTKTELAGGFKEGDLVPPDITTVQVKKSYTSGFGFAITFTKP